MATDGTLMVIFVLLQMDQYMALSKKDLMIHITLNELYNTHSLILQHIETLVCIAFRSSL
jgi:hypothetical protein